MTSLWELASRGMVGGAEFHDRYGSFRLADLRSGATISCDLDALRDKCVLLMSRGQLASALALLEIDGVARRVVLCTPDLTPDLMAAVAAASQADAVLGDEWTPRIDALPFYSLAYRPCPARSAHRSSVVTEWILLTSGTTSTPKLVVHTLDSLIGAIPREPLPGSARVWSTCYDIRRYGGLQIYLRAVLAAAWLVLSSEDEPMGLFMARAARHGVTHLSGTPTHWRRALMSGDASFTPAYVRLSGEVADQAVLDALHTRWPSAQVGHAFASTEAGVAFEVSDGREGFPSALLAAPGAVELRIVDDTLRIRSERIAARYVGSTELIGGRDGFVDTGDWVECHGERCYFRGRRGGVINVGGLKVFPEEVEAVLNADRRVHMSRVYARNSALTGALVVADVVLADPWASAAADVTEPLKDALFRACRSALSAHKVPTSLRWVAALDTTAAGKLERHA